MKKLYQIVLKGDEQVWCIDILLRPEDFADYQRDGLPIAHYPFTTWKDEWKARLFSRGKLYGVQLEGESSTWSLTAYLQPAAVKDMEADGIDCVYEIANIIPKWVVDAGLVRAWCVMQDIINFRWKEIFLNKEELL